MDSKIQILNDAGLNAVFAGSTNGGEYKAACPHCRSASGDGGTDRLCIWPIKGRAWCRRCAWSGTLAQLLSALTGVRKSKAKKAFAKTDGAIQARPSAMAEPRVARDVWRARVERLIANRATELHLEECTEHLDYLLGRGLTEATINAARLGGCFRPEFYERGDFGLPDAVNTETGKSKKLCIPAGILIPYLDSEGACLKVQSRCDDARDAAYGRYRVLPGSEPVCMTLVPRGSLRAVVAVESALDALLCHQEVPRDFAFVALGSTAYKPDRATDKLFRDAPCLLVATDSDAAGAEASTSLRGRYANAHRLIVPRQYGKDIGEAFLRGVSLRDWCEGGLELASSPPRSPQPSKVNARKNGGDARSNTHEAACEVIEFDAVQLLEDAAEIPYTVIANARRVKAAIQALSAAQIIAIDIETAPLPEHRNEPGAALDPWRSRPRLVQAVTRGEVQIFDLDAVNLGDLAGLFSGPWVAHNAAFDYKHLLHAGLELRKPHCTMLCDNAVMNRNLSLAEACSTYFGVQLEKTEQKSDWSRRELSPTQLRYAAVDAMAVLALWQRVSGEVGERKRQQLCLLMHEAQPAIAQMELNGLGFDADAHGALMLRWIAARKAALKNLREVAGPDLNPKSPEQVAHFLEAHATRAQLKAWPRTKSGHMCTAADELAAFRGSQSVDLLLEYRRWNDLLTKFGTKLVEQVSPVTGRLHPHFRIAGARTGRLSANAPNVQGLPHDAEFRRLFVPEPGHVLVRADYNQMQLRIAALLSGDARLLDAYEKGRDVHRITAASVLGKSVDAISGQERSLAKAIGFGILFGMGAKGLRRYAMSNYGVAVSDEQAGRIRQRFFDTYPEVHRWQRAQAEEAQRTGCSVTPMGRVRNFTREEKGNIHTAALNTPVQGAEGEVMLAALGLLPDALGPLDAHPINCVHDEILIECPKRAVEEVKAALRGCMERGMRHVFPRATLNGLVELGHGPTWADAK